MRFERKKTAIVTLSIIVIALTTPCMALAKPGGGHAGGGGHGGGERGGGHVSGGGRHAGGGGPQVNSGRGAVYANPPHRGGNYAEAGRGPGGRPGPNYRNSDRYYSGYRGFNYGPGYRYGLGAGFGPYGYSYFPWYSGLGLYALGVGRGYGGYGYNNYGYGGNYSGAYYSGGESVPLESQPTTEKLPADQDYVPQLNDTTAELAAGASGNAVLGITMDSQYPQAAVVRTVTPGAPADRAGLHPGDMITSIDQKQVQSFNDVVNLIAGMQPGAQIAIQFVRPILRSEVQAAAPEPQPQQQPSAPVAAPPAPPAPSSLPTPPQLDP